MDWAGGETGPGFAVQGNILAGPAVTAGMAKAYRETKGEMAERLIAALEAAQAAGGDKRGMQSAALMIMRPSTTHPQYNTRYIDLRVEDHKTPIKELRRVWNIFEGFHLANAHLDFADEYDAEGRHDLARLERDRVGESMQRALKRNDRDVSLLNGLAWACATHDMFLGDAVEAAKRGSAIEPRNVDILDTLAEAYFRDGQAAKAIEVEKRAASIDTKSVYLKQQIERFQKGPVQ
jgi:tetratricopeptide (TPR) repeat protein